MPKDARKFRNMTPVTPLNTLKPNIRVHTASDRVHEYCEALALVMQFHNKWKELRNSDAVRAKNYEARVHDRIEVARRARDELIRLGIDYKQYM